MTAPAPAPDPEIAAGLARVRAEIAAAAAAVGRDPASITLVAVGKTHPAERMAAALVAGQRVFGENRVQEARGKWPSLRARWPGLELHLIGPLQTNKVRDAVALFDVIQTLDRPRLAEQLSAEIARTGRRPRLFVQVNTGEEPQKAGVAPGALAGFVDACRARHGLAIDGLMCIPPVDDDPSLHFALLGTLAARLGLPGLSMGMSGDYGLAARFGATHVRVGTAIFGVRPTGPATPGP